MTVMKRILLLVLTFAMVASVIPAAFAEEEITSEEDVYVLVRSETVGGTSPNMQFESVYKTQYAWNEAYGGKLYPAIYTMRHPNGSIVPTYCLDIKTEAEGGTSYRRLNLEDAGYFSSVAGQIRTIVNNGFYVSSNEFTEYDSAEEAIRAEYSALGEASGVPDLTLSEAISATQCAIWQAVHGSVLSFDHFYVESLNKSMQANAVTYASLCKEEIHDPAYPSYMAVYLSNFSDTKRAQINDRIRTVYNYLISLSPTPAQSTEIVVSPASFTELHDPKVTLNTNGTYNVSVTTTVNVNMKSNDTLTLKAKLGDKSQSVSLQNGSQKNTFTFENVSEELSQQEVKLSISGYQTASGVFLFDAEGERGSSQTMVAMDSSRLPVYAEVTAQEDRTINITKTTTSGDALAGIIFDIYFIATMENSGNIDLQNPPSSRTDLADYTLITSVTGNAVLNLTQHGLEDGVYLVVERPHPSIVAPLAPFYVLVPDPNTESPTVVLQPKNEVKGGITIGKDVNKLNNDEAPVDAYSDHTWIISTSIPDDISTVTSYVISDTLDNRLDYKGIERVTVETVDGETVVATLEKDTDYELNVSDVDSLTGEKPSDSFTLSLTPSGRTAVAAAVGTNSFGDYRIRVRFDAQVNANAAMGAEIPNQASVSYTNSVNYTFTSDSEMTVVYTGGANLLKVDKDNSEMVLPGATFEVYRTATQEEVAANQGLVTLKNQSGSFVRVSFFNNANLAGSKVTSVTSGDDGKIAIYGLAPGKYYLVETQAPAGYNLPGEPIELTIDGTSHLDEHIVTVQNVSGTVLPETGGAGTDGFILTGIILTALSVFLLISKKRRFQA